MYGSGLTLIALGIGFKVYAEASANQKKSLKQLGRLVGGFIMIVSFIGSVCMISCAVKAGKSGYFGKMCPLTGQSMPMSEMK